MSTDDRTGLPDPLTPPEADMDGLNYMPLQINRLRNSKAWLTCKRTPELGFYMVNLWMRAWQEKPAGSIEYDPDVLADAAGCYPQRWDEVQDTVLRGWVLCSDGRLYHPVVAEVVMEAWAERLKARWHKECDRIRKENHARKKDGKPEILPPLFEEFCSRPAKESHKRSAGNSTNSAGKKENSAGNSQNSTGKRSGEERRGEERSGVERSKHEIHTGQTPGQETQQQPDLLTTKAPEAEKPKAFDPVRYLVSKGVEEQTARDWIKTRKAKDLAPTETAFKGVEREAEKAGVSLQKAIQTCCENGWGGFKAEWMQKSMVGNPATGTDSFSTQLAAMRGGGVTLDG
jgi:hypothetical protein